MTIKPPSPSHISALRQLWKQAFGDTDAFLDRFFQTAYAPERCRILLLEDQPAAALYWFDCSFQGQPLAYLYAVATAPVHRGKGLCRALIADTHRHLQALGYAGALLVPGEASLFRMYEKLGYRVCSHVRREHFTAGIPKVPFRQIDAGEYARLRRQFLPPEGVLQEGATLAFLQAFADFYTGDGFLMAATPEENTLVVSEYLGDPAFVPGILTSVERAEGLIRMPGRQHPFAMYYPLSDEPAPAYFGLALD